MGKTSAITWTHSTFNGWIGCEHAPMEGGGTSPLCDHCYAEHNNARWLWNGGGWGPGAARKLTSVSYWNDPFRWDREAMASGLVWRVFAFSLADIFDEAEPGWPQDRPLPGLNNPARSRSELTSARDVFLREVVARTPHLTWLLLTKRFKAASEILPAIFGKPLPPNIWPIFSAGTQATLEESMRYLPRIQAGSVAEYLAYVHASAAISNFEMSNVQPTAPETTVLP